MCVSDIWTPVDGVGLDACTAFWMPGLHGRHTLEGSSLVLPFEYRVAFSIQNSSPALCFLVSCFLSLPCFLPPHASGFPVLVVPHFLPLHSQISIGPNGCIFSSLSFSTHLSSLFSLWSSPYWNWKFTPFTSAQLVG